MIPASTNLDFYAAPPSHRDLHRRRLNAQREHMFDWRNDAAGATFHSITGRRIRAREPFATGSRQRIVADSARAADAAEAPRKARETAWTSAAAASALAPDRRRQWRQTGFTFERDHFKKGSSGGGGTRPQRSLSGRVEDPYQPYFHDSTAFLEPVPTTAAAAAAAKKASVTAFAVTHNAADSEDAAATKKYTESDNAAYAAVTFMSPALAGRQRSVVLAENMYQGLVMRQSALTGTAPGSAESINIRLPTSELAYTLRSSYVDKVRSRRGDTTTTNSSAIKSNSNTVAGHGRCVSSGRPVSGIAPALGSDVGRRGSVASASSRRDTAPPADVNVTGNNSPMAAGAAAARAAGETSPPHAASAGSEEEEERQRRRQSCSQPDDLEDAYDVPSGEAWRPPPARKTSDDATLPNADGPEPSYGSDDDNGNDNGSDDDNGNDNGSDDDNGNDNGSDDDNRSQQRGKGDGTLGGTATTSGSGGLPTEAKATRLYAITLRRQVTDQDAIMVRRREPLRRGVPVVLPVTWRAPMSD